MRDLGLRGLRSLEAVLAPFVHWRRLVGCLRLLALLLLVVVVAEWEAHSHPPIGALGLAPQKSWVPAMPIRCTPTRLSTIDFAVAVPTPTGPPLAVYP